MQRLGVVHGCSGAVLWLALAGSVGCDKLPGFGGGEPAQAENQEPRPTKPAGAVTEPGVAPVVAPVVDPSLSPTPTDVAPAIEPATVQPATEPTPPIPPAMVELEDLLVRVSKLADPRHAMDPTAEQNNKTAWTHYKANQWTEAAQFFARTTARDPTWKPAHNLACALVKAGQLDDARIALTASVNRGGAPARASAKKDSDLATVRELAWYVELLAEPVAADDDDEEEEIDPDMIAPANCPPGVTYESEHYCWHDVLAEFVFEELVFATSVSLSLEVPAKPKDRSWKLVKSKIPWKELRAELGIQHTLESEPLWEKPTLLEWSSSVWEDQAVLEQDADELTPYFWWPEPNTPILVLPNQQKLGSRRFMGVILARKTEAGWQAINLTVTKPSQLEGFTNETFESGVILRFDGLELFTMTQHAYHDGSHAEVDERSQFLCRIRWEQGKLARACTETWKSTGKPWG